MANFSQSLSDSVRFFGPQRSTKWGSPMKFGTDKWGNGLNNGNFDLPAAVREFNNDPTLTFSDSTSSARFISVGVNSLSFTQGSGQSESLYDGSKHYFYILSGGTTNQETGNFPSYSKVSTGSSTWSQLTNSSTSWVIT